MVDRISWSLAKGRIVAPLWLGIDFLLVRIATSGTFSELRLQWAPWSRALLTATGLFVAGLAVVLAALLVARPSPALLAVSVFVGLLMVPFGVVLLSIHHDSAVFVALLGLLIACLSAVGWLRARRPASDT
jgi:hypothetical protein